MPAQNRNCCTVVHVKTEHTMNSAEVWGETANYTNVFMADRWMKAGKSYGLISRWGWQVTSSFERKFKWGNGINPELLQAIICRSLASVFILSPQKLMTAKAVHIFSWITIMINGDRRALVALLPGFDEVKMPHLTLRWGLIHFLVSAPDLSVNTCFYCLHTAAALSFPDVQQVCTLHNRNPPHVHFIHIFPQEFSWSKRLPLNMEIFISELLLKWKSTNLVN